MKKAKKSGRGGPWRTDGTKDSALIFSAMVGVNIHWCMEGELMVVKRKSDAVQS